MRTLDLRSANKKINNTRLALDIGTNSIGWALYKIDKNKKPCSIAGAGVRIFPSGRMPKDYTTVNATRRLARLARRQRDRYLQRRAYLLIMLEKYGLFPADRFSAKKLADLNPYELRTKGLDEKLDLYHFGRALFHLNQKRGFKSNRRSGNEKEDGLIVRSVEASKKEMEKYNARTYGEFLWQRFQKMEKSRKKPGSQQENWVLARKATGAGAKDNYAVYAQRAMLKEEFHKLWDSQARFYDILKNKQTKKVFFEAIFHQRPLKQPVVGICELTGEKRIHKALPSFQQFRILKELNNLAYVDSYGHSHLISLMKNGITFRDKIIKDLFQKKDKIKFSDLENAFKTFFPEIKNFADFNLHTYNRNYLEGNKTSIILRKTVPDWDTWPLDIQDCFIEKLEGEEGKNGFMKTDTKILEDLQNFNKEKKLNLSEAQLSECLNKRLNKLPKDHGQYSKLAIQNILPFLRQGKQEFESVPLAGYSHHSDRRYKGELLKTLPLYQEVLSSQCVEMRPTGKKSDKDKPNSKKERYKTFRIPNPTVHIAFNQLRLVVNDIISVYGKPMQVVIETAKDLPMGEKSKKELERRQKDNKKQNEKAGQVIEEFNQINNRANRFRYLLWTQQNQKCIYSGKPIPKNKLYTAELEVDHILPWSRTLDDGLSNKVLVYKSSNQNKGSQTPFECFSSNKQQWEEILQRVQELPTNKKWRFNKSAIDKFKEEGGWLERQLNDTRYISRYASKYLERICKDVWTVRGQTTYVLRHLLQHEKKNRDDHRNHAKDALVIGLIDRSFVQHISNITKNIEAVGKASLENIGKAIKKETLPWSSFKDDAKQIIEKVIVSHRKRTKKEGRLHNETAYGFHPGTKDFSKPIDVFHYVDLLKLAKANKKKIEKEIISDKIKQDFLQEFDKTGSLSKEFLTAYHQKTGIRRVRLTEKKTVIPIRDKSGRIYKAFNGDGNYAVKLFIKPDGKWDAEVIDTFTANQKNFEPVPANAKLMKGDMLFFDNKFWKLVGFNTHRQLIFAEHFEANVDARNRSKENEYQYTRLSPASLQKHNPKRVDISPCGIVKLSTFDLLQKKGDSSEKSA